MLVLKINEKIDQRVELFDNGRGLFKIIVKTEKQTNSNEKTQKQENASIKNEKMGV